MIRYVNVLHVQISYHGIYDIVGHVQTASSFEV